MAANINPLTASQFFGAQQQPQPQPQRPTIHPQQMKKFITQQVSSHPIPPGWQVHHLSADRVGKIAQMVTNSQLANSNADHGEILLNALKDERNLFVTSATKKEYEEKISERLRALFLKRQTNEQSIREDLSAQAAAQHQHQAQQMAQLQAIRQRMSSQNPQLAHLPQIQGLPMPPQQNPQLPLNIMASNGQQMQGQPGFPIPMAPTSQQPSQMGLDLKNLSQADYKEISEIAQRISNSMSQEQANHIRNMALQRATMQQRQIWQAHGKDPATMMILNEAQFIFLRSRQQAMGAGQTMQGIPPNANQIQQRALMQQQQQRMSMANPQVSQGPNGMNQMAGNMGMAGPVRNATPQPPPMPNMTGLNGPNQGPNQTSRPQMNDQQQVNLAQPQGPHPNGGNALTGQPGGLGPIAPSQSPSLPMNTLNAPPPMSGMQVPNPMANPQVSNPALVQAVLKNFPPEKQAQIRALPPAKQLEFINQMLQTKKHLVARLTAQGALQTPNPIQTVPLGPNSLGASNVRGPNGIVNPQLMQPMQATHIPLSQSELAISDSQEVPPGFLARLGVPVPPTTKRWKEIKQYLANGSAPSRVQQHALQLQRMHFNTLKQHLMANQGQNLSSASAGPGGRLQNQPGLLGHQAGNMTPAIMANLPPNLHPTPDEVAQFRASQPCFKDAPEETVRTRVFQLKQKQFQQLMMKKAQAQEQQQHQQQQQQQQPQPHKQQRQHQNPQNPLLHSGQPKFTQAPQTNASQAVVPPATGPQQAPQPHLQLQQRPPAPHNKGPPTQPLSTTRPQSTKPEPSSVEQKPNSSKTAQTPPPAASAVTSKKRSAEEAANPPSTPTQRPGSQPNGALPGSTSQKLTPQVMANLAPEQRAQIGQETKVDMKARISAIRANVANQFNSGRLNGEVQNIPPDQRMDYVSKLKRTCSDLSRVTMIFEKWFQVIGDEPRAEQFFKARCRLFQQLDQDKNVKEKVTVSFKELDQIQNMLSSIGSDIKRKFPSHMKKPGGGQLQPQNPQHTPMQQQPSQQAHQQRSSQQAAAPNSQAAQQAQSQPAPLSTENLQIHQQMSKNHQRTASKSGLPPTAPTPSQPTFQIGGGSSPHGEPTYANKPTITQESLHLPPRKRAKKDAVGTHQAQAASPQFGKAQSPDLRKQMPQEAKAPPKTSFVCPYSGCEMQTIGFEDERSLKMHVVEEHEKPSQDPVKFAFNCLSEAFGVDPSGQDTNAPPMAQADPKEGQLPMKIEASSTPTTREASMKRQGSNAGGKAAEVTSGNVEIGLDETISKPPSDPWAGATIDPQTISSIFKPLAGAGNGAISDPSLTLYRSLTPNDTPESIKDSGSSELNSDISESANLDIDVAINNLVDPEMISDLNLVNLDAMEDPEHDQSNFSKSLFSDIPPLDDVTVDFSKPFDMNTLMNTGLYGLNFN